MSDQDAGGAGGREPAAAAAAISAASFPFTAGEAVAAGYRDPGRARGRPRRRYLRPRRVRRLGRGRAPHL